MHVKPKIGFDVDEVLSDFIKAHRAICVKMFGKPEDPDLEPHDWAMSNYGLSSKEMGAVWVRLHGTRDFWLDHVEPLGPGLKGTMQRADREFEIYYITARAQTKGMTVQQQTSRWLKQHLGVYEPIVLAVTGGAEKYPIITALGLKAFIDDKLETAMEVGARTAAKSFLMNREYNTSVHDAYFTRIHSVEEYLDGVGGLDV